RALATSRGMDAIAPLDSFRLRAPLWLINMEHAEQGENHFLQAEGPQGNYLLVFTSATKAHDAMQALGERRGTPTCLSVELEMQLDTALCQVGARGIVVDFDPASRRAAWSRELVARA